MDLSKLSQSFNILNASQNTKMAKVKKVASIKKTQRPVEKRQADALAVLYSKFCKDLDNIQVIRIMEFTPTIITVLQLNYLVALNLRSQAISNVNAAVVNVVFTLSTVNTLGH